MLPSDIYAQNYNSRDQITLLCLYVNLNVHTHLRETVILSSWGQYAIFLLIRCSILGLQAQGCT